MTGATFAFACRQESTKVPNAARALARKHDSYHRGTETQRHREVVGLHGIHSPSVPLCLCLSVIGQPRSPVESSRLPTLFGIGRTVVVRACALLLAFALLCASPSRAADLVSVSASLGRTSAVLGDQVDYAVNVSAPPGALTTVSGLGEALARAGLELAGSQASIDVAALAAPVSTGEADATTGAVATTAPADLRPDTEHTSQPGETQLTARVWRLAVFQLGEVELAGARVDYVLADGTRGSQPIPAVRLQVAKVTVPGGAQVAEGQMFGVKPPVTLVIVRGRRWWLPALIVLVGLLVALYLWKPDLLKRLFGRGPRPLPPPKPPHTRALEQLDLLMTEGLLDRGLAREHYGRLSEILRTYLDGRFLLRSMEATTDELCQVLRNHQPLGRSFFEPLRKFLMTCDLAKFARHVPPRTLGDELAGFVRGFVRQTMPETETGTGGATAGPAQTAAEGLSATTASGAEKEGSP